MASSALGRAFACEYAWRTRRGIGVDTRAPTQPPPRRGSGDPSRCTRTRGGVHGWAAARRSVGASPGLPSRERLQGAERRPARWSGGAGSTPDCPSAPGVLLATASGDHRPSPSAAEVLERGADLSSAPVWFARFTFRSRFAPMHRQPTPQSKSGTVASLPTTAPLPRAASRSTEATLVAMGKLAC